MTVPLDPSVAAVSSAPAAAEAPPFTFPVYGTPAPQGSKRHVGRGVMVESSAKVKPWREAVKWAALAYRGDTPPFDGPVAVFITFTLPKPGNAPKRRRTWPMRRPDLDKLIRSSFDAIGEAGIWIDDAQVVSLGAAKVFPGEDVGALDAPGAVITVAPVGAGAPSGQLQPLPPPPSARAGRR